MTKRLISNWKRGDVLDYWTWRRQTGRLEVTSWSTTWSSRALPSEDMRPQSRLAHTVRWPRWGRSILIHSVYLESDSDGV